MNNRIFQKAINLVFTLALAFGLLLPGSTTLALPQKAAPMAEGISTPNDTLYSSQWNLSDRNVSGFWGINAPAAWNITNGSSIVVAVIDSGIGPNIDLDTNRLLAGYDFITDTAIPANDFSDPGTPVDCGGDAWHGTHVAGIIGAKSNNATGVAGINWAANILPVRVSGTCVAATAADLMDGMSWAAGLPVSGVTTNPNPSKVINVSVGVPGESCTTHQTAINAIIATGAVIVAAAGDSGLLTNTIDFPANCDIPGVITVAATDKLGSRANFSSYGSTVEISAPGGGNTQGDVISTTNTGTTTPELPASTHSAYTTKQGTGIAAAHVSGVVSLMLSANPAMTPSQIVQTLQQTAQAFPSTVGIPCTTSICGSGIVDAWGALKPDLIITKVGLAPLASTQDECPATQPSYNPAPNELFCVNITVKNQGGSSSGSIVYRNVYIDRDPSALPRDPVDGSIVDGNGDLDPGDYFRQDINTSIPAGAEVTQGVKIYIKDSNPPDIGLPAGSHTIYAYTDAQNLCPEVLENNNDFAPVSIVGKKLVQTDFNGDGKHDIAVFRPSNSTWYIYGQGFYVYGQAGDIPVPADYDGDGKTDIAVFRPSNSTWYIYGKGSFVYGGVGDIPVVADYNGDGKADIAVFRPTNSTWYLYGIGPFSYGTVGDIPVIADYNGDGKADIAVFRPTNSTWYLYGIGPFSYGTVGDIPVVADYNGDGKADIAVFRPTNSTWYLYGIGPFSYGTVGDSPVIGDYNGDGKADITVFRPTNSTWYLYGIGPFTYGMAGDIPIK